MASYKRSRDMMRKQFLIYYRNYLKLRRYIMMKKAGFILLSLKKIRNSDIKDVFSLIGLNRNIRARISVNG